MKKNFRKALSIFLTLLIILSIAPTNIVTKANATDEGITWTFDGETVTISGTGELSKEYTTTDEWKNMQDECVNVIIEGEIEAIGDNAFKDFTAIENVEVTGLLEKVGKNAFSNCTSLESITLPDSVSIIDEYAFSGCKALKDFRFPQNLLKINQWAFKGCECFDNKELVLPDTLQKVGYGAFSGANITSLTAPFVGVGVIKNEDFKSSNSIGHMFGNVSFSDTYIFRDGVYAEYYYMPNSLKEVTITKHIYDNNFENTKKIERIVIKDTVEATCIPYAFANKSQELKEIIIENPVEITKIDSNAFDCCYALEGITIPENVTEIGYRAFACCRFSSIEIPSKVEVIGDYAFFKCTGITSIVFPDSVKSIGEYAFKGCSNLENIKFPSTYYTIGDGAFDETKYTGAEYDFVITEDGVLTRYRGTDTEVVVPEGVTHIGTVFADNKNITSVILPNSLLYIEENAFSGCSALTKIVLPESLEYISENSFSDCSSLTEINLPDGLLTIPENAFKGCSSLPVLTIPDTVLEIKPGAFYGCCKIKELIIPDSVVKIERRALAGMCGLEKLTVPFIGQSRDVKTNSLYALIGYWFDSDQDDLHGSNCDYCIGYFNKVNQTYSDRGYKSAHNIWEPSNFKELTVNGGTLRSYAFNEFNLEILNIGENVEVIEECAADNLGLKELNFHEDAKFTEIPYRAFSNNSFTSVTIPKNVKKIGEAFTTYGGYTNVLSEINLNEGLEVIERSFVNAKITSIDLPDSLITIGRDTFLCCQRLEYIEFPENLTEIHGCAFNRAGLKEIVFSESIQYIQGAAFNRCPVKKIVIPESLVDLAEEIFKECEELEVVVIGGNVEEIGSMAFADCPTLETVVIPDSVEYISEDAFENAGENLVIYCNEGSYAQTYATENNIKYTTLVIDPIENQKYTGKEIKPEIKASANNRKLTQDTEYSVSYKDNINAGSAKAIVKGLGDFKHLAATAKFTILPQGVENISVINDSPTYRPDGIEPKVYVYNGTKKLIEGQDYELLNTSAIKNAGEYNIAVSLIGNYDGVININYKVARRSIKQTEIMLGDTVKVVYDGVQLKEGKDFIVTKETNEKGDVVTTVEGIGNYEGTFTHTEDNKSSGNSEASESWIIKLINLIKQFFERLFNIGN